MSGSPFYQGIVIRHSWFLRGARDTVEVGDKSNKGVAASVGSDPSRRNPGNAAFGMEAILFQNIRDVARGFEFLEAQLAEAENFVVHLLGKRLQFVDLRDCFLLQTRKGVRLLSKQCR